MCLTSKLIEFSYAKLHEEFLGGYSMEKDFDTMVNRSDLINLGFKANQATQMIKEAKKFLINIEGVELYNNRQINMVPSRVIEELFHLKINK